MNDKQREVLLRAYNSFDIQTEYFDFEIIGKVMVIRRMLAELLCLNLLNHIMPGEYTDDDTGLPDELRFIEEKELSTKGEQSLTKDEQYLLEQVLRFSSGMSGLTDSDDACLRCARRMLAEVLGKPLNGYGLMGERELKPIYYKDYQNLAT
jgi:hypothetical protein